MEVYHSCYNTDNLADLKKLLISMFDNPRMKKIFKAKESDSTSTTKTTGALAIGQAVPSTSGAKQPDGIGKLISKLNSVNLNLNAMKSTPPYKPRISPPRGRGRQFQRQGFQPRNRSFGRGFGGNNNNNNNFRRNNYNNFQGRRYNNNNNFGNNNFVNRRGTFRGRGRFQSFQNSPNVKRSRVAGKAVNKDDGRCHYCKEHGHFIRECRKRMQDEKRGSNLRTINEVDEKGDLDFNEFDDLAGEISSLNI